MYSPFKKGGDKGAVPSKGSTPGRLFMAVWANDAGAVSLCICILQLCMCILQPCACVYCNLCMCMLQLRWRDSSQPPVWISTSSHSKATRRCTWRYALVYTSTLPPCIHKETIKDCRSFKVNGGGGGGVVSVTCVFVSVSVALLLLLLLLLFAMCCSWRWDTWTSLACL